MLNSDSPSLKQRKEVRSTGRTCNCIVSGRLEVETYSYYRFLSFAFGGIVIKTPVLSASFYGSLRVGVATQPD